MCLDLYNINSLDILLEGYLEGSSSRYGSSSHSLRYPCGLLLSHCSNITSVERPSVTTLSKIATSKCYPLHCFWFLSFLINFIDYAITVILSFPLFFLFPPFFLSLWTSTQHSTLPQQSPHHCSCSCI